MAKKSWLSFCIILGAITGSIVGDFLGGKFPFLQFLKTSYTIGLSDPMILKLRVIDVTFGLSFNINIMTILGIILAILFCKKYNV